MSSRADEASSADPVVARVQALLDLAARHRVSELMIEAGDFKLRLRAHGANVAPAGTGQPLAEAPVAEPNSAAATTDLIVVAPMIGTFYPAPAPSEPPFVTVGDRIELGQTVAIIEAMKIMNEIQSDQTGVLVEVLVRDGQGVEYGQPLFRLQPL